MVMGSLFYFFESVQSVVVMLTSVFLIFCTQSLILLLSNGHHEDLPKNTIEQILLAAAAVSAPASVYLTEAIGQHYAVLIGSALTCISLTVGSMLTTLLKSLTAFAVFYGIGVSVLFQSSALSFSSPPQRKNLLSTLSVLSLSGILITFTPRLLDHITIAVQPNVALLLLATCIVLLNVLPSVCCIFIQRKNHRNTRVSGCSCQDGVGYSGEKHKSHLANMCECQSQTMNEFNVMVDKDDVQADNNSQSASQLYLEDIKWRAIVVVWWGAGVDLALDMNQDFLLEIKIFIIMFILSLMNLAFILIQTRRNVNYKDCGFTSCYFISIGLLGISGLNVSLLPNRTSPIHHALLFTIGYFLQLTSSTSPYNNQRSSSSTSHIQTTIQTTDKVLKEISVGAVPMERSCHLTNCIRQMDRLNWIVNVFCIEIVFALCGMAAGVIITSLFEYMLLTPLLPDIVSSTSSLGLISTAAIIISLIRPV